MPEHVVAALPRRGQASLVPGHEQILASQLASAGQGQRSSLFEHRAVEAELSAAGGSARHDGGSRASAMI